MEDDTKFIQNHHFKGVKKARRVEKTLFIQSYMYILIQLVMSAIPFYAMQTMKLLEEILKDLELLSRQFFWGDDECSRKFHTISWETIHRDKEHGGLGIKDLSLMNKAFLTKLAWRFFTNPEALWATILKAKYGILLPPRVVQAGCSQVWKGINTGAKTILKGMEVERN